MLYKQKLIMIAKEKKNMLEKPFHGDLMLYLIDSGEQSWYN